MKKYLTAEDFIEIASDITQHIDLGRITKWGTLNEAIQHCGMTKSILREKFPYIDDEGDEEPPSYPEKHRDNVIDYSPPSLWHQALSRYLKTKYTSYYDLPLDRQKELRESDERISRWVCGSSYKHLLPNTYKIFYVSD